MAARAKPAEVPVTQKAERVSPPVEAARRFVAARPAKTAKEPDFAYLAEESADDLVASVSKLKATLAAVRAELLRRKGVIDEALAEVGEEAAA
jgi:hypothetical protein